MAKPSCSSPKAKKDGRVKGHFVLEAHKEYYSKPTIPISDCLLYDNPFLNTQYFNLCISWSINSWNFEKHSEFNTF
ncbi:hypothetical protein H8356DRAFT_1338935 [Neocallimastix lanati (nom. inval.)]|nr:hypothetical protein H8356DRAFT_1338935 [Neocallimastix sp. JGI-2020a]